MAPTRDPSTPRVTVRQLEAFLALADSGHFRRAAERLGVSQPTLTGQIAALERGLDALLFERSPTGSRLTAAGRSVLPRAKRVVAEYRGLLEHARHLGAGDLGTLRLGVTPTLGPYLLPHILPELHRSHGGLKLHLRESTPRNLERGVLVGEYDLVLTPLPVDDAEHLIVEPLFREPLALVLSTEHRLARRKRIRPADLTGEPVLVLDEHHLFHRQVEQLCEELGAHVLRDFEGTSLDALRHMVVMGMGISFLPALYVASEIHQPETLVVTRVTGAPMERTHALVWRASSPEPEPLFQLAEDIRAIVAARLPGHVTVIGAEPRPQADGR